MIPKCCICEKEEGEEGCKLIPIHTGEGVVPMCNWPCMVISATHCFMKCRVCGSVATIPKWAVPGGHTLGFSTFIIFVEDCKFHKGDLRWTAKNVVRNLP